MRDFLCTHGVSLHPQRPLLGTRWPGPSTQHQPGAGDQPILRGTTLPLPLFAAHPAANISSHQLPSAFSQVVPHNPHLQTSILHFFFLSLSQPLGPGVLCLGGRAVHNLELQNTSCRRQQGQSSSPPGMGPRACEAPALQTRVVKPPAPTHLFDPRGPLHGHLQPEQLLLVGFLLTWREITCHCLHKASPELLFNQLRGTKDSSRFML